jgi:transcriptional regulator with XRE-family HTH domain
MSKIVRYEDWLEKQMQDPEFRAAYEELDPAHQVARLRIMRGLTQEQLASLVGTRQPNIARLESGRTAPSLPFLRRVVEALGGELEIKIKVPDETRTASHGR